MKNPLRKFGDEAGRLASLRPVDRVAVWIWPPEDLEAWRELTGDTLDRRGYMERIYEVERRLALDGRKTVRVNATVAQIRAALAERGWENTTQNRAGVIAALAENE